MRVLAFLFIVLLSGAFVACRDKRGEFIERLTPEQKDVFPKDYYTLDTLHMVYTDTGRTDTFVLVGGKVEEYVVRDWHAGAYNGWATSHEVIRKQFHSLDGKNSMAIRVSTSEDDDDGYPSGGGVLISALKRNTSFHFFDMQDSTEDQVIPAVNFYGYAKYDTVVYNKISGVRRIMIRSVKNPYTLEFYR